MTPKPINYDAVPRFETPSTMRESLIENEVHVLRRSLAVMRAQVRILQLEYEEKCAECDAMKTLLRRLEEKG